MLNSGDLAPDFIIKMKDNKSTKLSTLNHDLLVLFFYPKSDTPGCTLEAQEFSITQKSFEELDTYIIGISKDHADTQKKFQRKHDITVLLNSDSDNNICETYGVWKEKNMYRRKFFGIVRTTFLINRERKIINVWNKVKPKGHVEEVLSYVKQFHT